jgi:TrmH family RNA methyltransferase
MTRRSDSKHAGVRAITSLQNDRIKAIRALDMRKARRESGQFVAEGTSVLVTARDAGWPPATLLFLAGSLKNGVGRDLLDWAEHAGAECLEVSAAVLAKVAVKDNPQSVLAVFNQRWAASPDPEKLPPEAVWVVLEAIRDPGNLGTIIRTADAVDAQGVILVGNSADPYSREAVRASMGSIFNVPIARMQLEEFSSWASRWRGDVVGTHLKATDDFRKPCRLPGLLVMGSEGPGLSPEAAGACTRLVKIPMAGRIDSLNIAVATALVLYEMRKGKLSL